MPKPAIIIFALAVAVWLTCEVVAPQGKPLHEPWSEEVSCTCTLLFGSQAEAKRALESGGAKGTFKIQPVFYVEVLKRRLTQRRKGAE